MSVIAGYHWFGDWGRDTMVSLPGLCLCTGRAEVARHILTTFARFVDQGMLPNVFPDSGESPNTIPPTPRCGTSRRCAPITRRRRTPAW